MKVGNCQTEQSDTLFYGVAETIHASWLMSFSSTTEMYQQQSRTSGNKQKHQRTFAGLVIFSKIKHFIGIDNLNYEVTHIDTTEIIWNNHLFLTFMFIQIEPELIEVTDKTNVILENTLVKVSLYFVSSSWVTDMMYYFQILSHCTEKVWTVSDKHQKDLFLQKLTWAPYPTIAMKWHTSFFWLLFSFIHYLVKFIKSFLELCIKQLIKTCSHCTKAVLKTEIREISLKIKKNSKRSKKNERVWKCIS